MTVSKANSVVGEMNLIGRLFLVSSPGLLTKSFQRVNDVLTSFAEWVLLQESYLVFLYSPILN